MFLSSGRDVRVDASVLTCLGVGLGPVTGIGCHHFGQRAAVGFQLVEHGLEVLGVRRLVRCVVRHDNLSFVVDGELAVVGLHKVSAVLHDPTLRIGEVALRRRPGRTVDLRRCEVFWKRRRRSRFRIPVVGYLVPISLGCFQSLLGLGRSPLFGRSLGIVRGALGLFACLSHACLGLVACFLRRLFGFVVGLRGGALALRALGLVGLLGLLLGPLGLFGQFLGSLACRLRFQRGFRFADLLQPCLSTSELLRKLIDPLVFAVQLVLALIDELSLLQQLSHFVFELLLALEHPLIALRLVLARVGSHLCPIERDVAQLHQTHFLAHPQHLHEQLRESLQVFPSKLTDPRVVRVTATRQHAKPHIAIRRLLQLPARRKPDAIPI